MTNTTRQERWDAVEAGTVDLDGHLDLARELAAARSFIHAIHVLNLASERFDAGGRELHLASRVFDAMEKAGGIERAIHETPPAWVKAFEEERASAQENHAENALNPPSRDFILCISLKNLAARLPTSAVARMSLLRLCDFYGQLSAEASWSESVVPSVISSGISTLRFGDRAVRYAVPPEKLWEYRLFFIFEPGLIRWLARFAPDDVFLDIGANVGRYSILAAAARGCRTIAIEPFSVNVDALSTNVRLNGLADRVTVLRAAMSDATGEGTLSFGSRKPGSAQQHFQMTSGATNSETVPGYRLDDLVSQGRIPIPTHIKLDVDGGEHRLIDGMTRTLADPRLKSIRIEIRIDEPGNRAALDRVRGHGFECVIDDDTKNYLCIRR